MGSSQSAERKKKRKNTRNNWDWFKLLKSRIACESQAYLMAALDLQQDDSVESPRAPMDTFLAVRFSKSAPAVREETLRGNPTKLGS